MDPNRLNLAPTGASMDRVIPKRRGKSVLLGSLVTLVFVFVGASLWYLAPSGLQVAENDIRVATVEKGIFRDDIVVRAQVEPLHSVILDSVESGRVEEVSVADGALVQKGQLLFRLSNPQRNLELLARQAEHAQQISNLSNLRVAQETRRTDHVRRLSDLEYALAQSKKQFERNARLAEQGFLSAAALEESRDQLDQQRLIVSQEQARISAESRVEKNVLEQIETAIKRLQTGLALVSSTVEALAVRAPVAGRMTGFRLQVGETVKTDQHIGRIDDPTLFKLSAQVDEFYLTRISVGRHGLLRQSGKEYAVTVSTIYPQIKDGRFTVEMEFNHGQPDMLSPGQSLDLRITLGEPAAAILIPNGPFANDTGAVWVFVVDSSGKRAERRQIKVGRRNNSQIEIQGGVAPGEKVIISSYAAFGTSTRLSFVK